MIPALDDVTRWIASLPADQRFEAVGRVHLWARTASYADKGTDRFAGWRKLVEAAEVLWSWLLAEGRAAAGLDLQTAFGGAF